MTDTVKMSNMFSLLDEEQEGAGDNKTALNASRTGK